MAFGPGFTSYRPVQPGQANVPGEVCTGPDQAGQEQHLSAAVDWPGGRAPRGPRCSARGYGLYYNSSVYANVAQQHVAAAAAGDVIQPVPDGRPAGMGTAFVNPAGRATNTLDATRSRSTPTTRSATPSNGTSACSRTCHFRSRPRCATRARRAPDLDRQIKPWVDAARRPRPLYTLRATPMRPTAVIRCTTP